MSYPAWRFKDRKSLAVRERQVLVLLAQGHCDKQVAYMLGIERSGVRKARQRIGRKLGSANLANMTRYAIRMGWVQP